VSDRVIPLLHSHARVSAASPVNFALGLGSLRVGDRGSKTCIAIVTVRNILYITFPVFVHVFIWFSVNERLRGRLVRCLCHFLLPILADSKVYSKALQSISDVEVCFCAEMEMPCSPIWGQLSGHVD